MARGWHGRRERRRLHLALRLPARLAGEARPRLPPSRGQEAEGLAAAGLGDSNSGPPPEVVPGGGCAGGPSCGALAPLVTARARCTPLPAAPHVPTVYRWAPVPSGRGRLGAPVLRDQGPIGRPGTARPGLQRLNDVEFRSHRNMPRRTHAAGPTG